MPDLKVEIDGQLLALKNCCWVQTMACGCIAAVTTADHEDGLTVLATEQQAHEHLSPTKRDRDRDHKRGFSLELMAFETYKDQFGGVDAWKCPHLKGETTQQTLDAAIESGDGRG